MTMHLELMNGDVGICLPGPDGVLRVAFPELRRQRSLDRSVTIRQR
jgi:hypothetical protein